MVVEKAIGPGNTALVRIAGRNAQIERQRTVALGTHSGRHQGHKTRCLAVREHTEGFLQSAADARLRRYHGATGRTEIINGHYRAPGVETANTPVAGGNEHVGAREK